MTDVMDAGPVKPEWWTSDHWSTPWDIVHRLEDEFGKFNLDPCCRDETAKADIYYTKKHNGLSMPWSGRVFMNPPYSRPGPWLEKAIQATTSMQEAATLVVALLPVRTDTRWFHQFVWGKAEIRFIKGRIKWLGWQGTPIPNPKDPSMFAIYRRTCELPKLQPLRATLCPRSDRGSAEA